MGQNVSKCNSSSVHNCCISVSGTAKEYTVFNFIFKPVGSNSFTASYKVQKIAFFQPSNHIQKFRCENGASSSTVTTDFRFHHPLSVPTQVSHLADNCWKSQKEPLPCSLLLPVLTDAAAQGNQMLLSNWYVVFSTATFATVTIAIDTPLNYTLYRVT